MKKLLKYFLIIMTFAVCFMTNAYAAITKDDIDWKSETIAYDDTTNDFNLVSSVNEGTFTYQWIQIGDDGSELTTAYNNFKDALNSGDEAAIEEKKLTLFTLLNTSAINDENWSASKECSDTLVSGNLYIKWAKFISTNGATSDPIYAFALYKVTGSSTSTSTSSSSSGSTVTNPDTGVSPLYVVPVLLILGSTLVFKKRRYE